jgi:stearoyl-CoA desaturase (delta-9 desaturase)
MASCAVHSGPSGSDVPAKSPFEDFLHALPKEVFEMSSRKAVLKLLFSIALVVLGVFLIRISPSFMLPLSWLLLGTAGTGLFAVGLSCGQNLFFRNKYVNYLVGTICMLLLMYPFEYWKSSRLSLSSVKNFSYRVANSPFWFLSSVVQWISSSFTFEFNRRMVVSATILYLFVAIFFPIMAYGVGIWGLFKYYFIPLLVYHFWMSTFLKANITSLINESPILWRFPSWVQFLSNDCNHGMIFANVTSKLMPNYKWKDAYNAVHQQFGQSLPELSFGYLLLPTRLFKLKLNKKQDASTPSTPTKGSITSTLAEINWSTTLFLFLTPLIALYGVITCPFNWKTYLLAFVTYYIAGIGITAGYHRLFSHRSYDAVLPVRIFLAILGTSAFEMSVIDWCNDHRAHHRYTDTDKDPYNVNKGFWWAHMGWLMFKRKEPVVSDVSDLRAQWFLRFQHKFFLPMSLFLGFGLPMLIAGYFWGDWKGGLLISGVLSKVVMLQCTFCINSLAHYLGEATYSDLRSPRDSPITSLVTFGEGYHNFHHEFPYDYRNGIKFYSYDPGKWIIATLSWFGLAYNLKRFPSALFEKGEIHMANKKLVERKSKLFWGKSVDELPMYTREMVESKPEKGLLIIADMVYDVSEFAETHPGGKKIIATYFGKDATEAFNGGVYNHSLAARHLLDTLRVARVLNSGGGEEVKKEK